MLVLLLVVLVWRMVIARTRTMTGLISSTWSKQPMRMMMLMLIMLLVMVLVIVLVMAMAVMMTCSMSLRPLPSGSLT